MAGTLWIATRKGAFALRADTAGSAWTLEGPQFLGHVIHHIVPDPRAPGRLLMAAKTGHLGPTVFRSLDGGRHWVEAARPPAFRKAADGEAPRSVDSVFWLTPGHASQAGLWYAGSAPAGLFRSFDHGETWEPVSGFNDHPMRPQWASGDGTPGGELTHSILVDPRDPQHLYLGISVGGVFESVDGGADWAPLNLGVEADFLPEPDTPFGHDPHCVVLHPAMPDRLYQQNHCGIYRIDRPAERWQRIGSAMPADIGDIGFPIVVHPRDPDVAWVFPMDGTEVWPRTSIGGKPAVYMTTDGGGRWQRRDQGLPSEQAWFTVYRQAMCADGQATPGLYFGNSNGEVWAGLEGGERWINLARHLPQIYALSWAPSP